LEFDLGLLKLWKSLKIDSDLWLILAALAVLMAGWVASNGCLGCIDCIGGC
jgi:hypothetical protein